MHLNVNEYDIGSGDVFMSLSKEVKWLFYVVCMCVYV